MRVKYSLINITVGIGSQIIITFLSFFSRTVFIYTLGVEYLGINALFTNILAMLSLAEAGIGTAIIYNLYKPVADNDQEKVNLLMKLYKKIYMVIAFIILLLGILLMPFLEYFTKGTNIENLYIIFSLFLFNTIFSYLFAHKISFLNVCQKSYIVTAFFTISSVISTLFKIGILYFTKNFILFLLVESVISIITTIILATVVNRMYSFLKEKVTSKLDKDTQSNIKKNVKAIVLHKIGGFAVFGTDNIIISTFVSVVAVGLYSNYYMLMDICRTFINQVFNNITHSVGNLVAKESEGKIYNVFKVTMFCNFWIYSFFSISLFVMLEPFITIWIGSDFLLDNLVLIIILANFYISGMRRSISIVKSTAGIFHEDRYAPLFEATINLGASILLVQYFGLAGVFMGTLISTIVVPLWLAPYLVYKKVFNKPLIDYFIMYILYIIVSLGALLLTSFISGFVIFGGLTGLVIKGLICLAVPNLVFLIIFYKTNEFKYLLWIIKEFVLKRFIKKKPKSAA